MDKHHYRGASHLFVVEVPEWSGSSLNTCVCELTRQQTTINWRPIVIYETDRGDGFYIWHRKFSSMRQTDRHIYGIGSRNVLGCILFIELDFI